MQMDEPVIRIMERTTNAGAVVLTIQGEIDVATVGNLRARLADACVRDLTIDLRRVTFLDCLGLRMLLEQHERCTRRGLRVDFVQGPAAVRRVFEATGTLDQLNFVEFAARRLASTG